MPTLTRADQEQFEKARDLLETPPSAEMGFVKSLFFGRLNRGQILPYPHCAPDEARRTDELLGRLRAFLAADVDPDRIDQEERIPPGVVDGLAQMGLLGMTVPAEYGGGGFSHTSYCRVIEAMARHCASTAVLVGAHQSIGLKALLLMGTEAQKQEFLPALARGEKLAAFCLSEPDVGSDAANVQTQARLSPDGQHWTLNGEKKFATNGALAGFLTVMARTPLTDNGETKEKVTAFIVTPDVPGFEIVRPNRSKCGIRGSWQATLRFTDMRIPHDRILGQLGKGLKVALSVLDFGRCTLSAGCLGAAKAAMAMAVQRARTRKQFGRTLGEFHLVKLKLARMAETVFAMDAVTYLAAGLLDRHAEDVVLETAICKLFCSEGAWQVIDDALQIWGGEGYMRENRLERMLRDARINRIVEGASEVMLAFIALMGMKPIGEMLERIQHSARRPLGHVRQLAAFVGSEWRDLILGPELSGLDPELAVEGRHLARLTKLLGRTVVRLLVTHRERVLELELVHERIAGAAAELYAMAATISKLQMLLEESAARAASNGHDRIAQEVVIGKSFCRHAARRILQRLRSFSTADDQAILRTADTALALEPVP